MKIVIQTVISVIILFPILLFFLTYIIYRKRKKNHTKAFGLAADLTTFILFFSVTLSVSSLWGVNYSLFIFMIALLIAIIITYIDWRSKKEIELLALFKRIWRTYFIILTVTYLFVWIVGLSLNIIEYVELV